MRLAYSGFLLACITGSAALCPGRTAGETQHTTYFKNTDYELNVYRIRGEQPGKTLMILGGVHNEPGGYLAADLYADMALQRGNLIVVPRANLPSVVTNSRLVNEDMNRRFGSDSPGQNPQLYEDKIVEVLKLLIRESDLFLNLHDGSGFFRPTWISELKNPSRWGQSIIADDATFDSPLAKARLALRERALRVLAKVNERIPEAEHRFHFNDTRTGHRDTPHPEMRQSATYFGLTQAGVESYGIETSREIEPLELKVKYQSMVINAFMEELGITPQNPKINLDPPRLQYLLVSVNGSIPYGIPNGQTFRLRKNDRIRIEHIAANYERGLVANVLNVGGINDLQKAITVTGPLTIRVMKDQFPCGEVYIDPTGPAGRDLKTAARLAMVLLRVDGETRSVPAGGIVELREGAVLTLDDAAVEGLDPSEVNLNMLGFVPPGRARNTGEDRGVPIRHAELLRRYAGGPAGRDYFVTASAGGSEIGRITIRYVR